MTTEDRSFLHCGRRLQAGASGSGVQGALLGKPPSYAPDRAYDALHVSLRLDVDLRRKSLSGSCETTVRARRSGGAPPRVQLRRSEKSPRSASTATSRASSFKDGKLLVSLAKDLSESAETIVTVQYRVEDPEAGCTL